MVYSINPVVWYGVKGGRTVRADLDAADAASHVRKAFQFVAEREGIPLTVRQKRKERCLELKFGKKATAPKAGATRLNAAEAAAKIMNARRESDAPMSRAEVLAATGLGPATWNVRVRELIESGKVVRDGKGRGERYREALRL